MQLRDKLKLIRLTKMVTMRVMAAELGITYSSVFFYEHGKCVPRFDLRRKYLELAALHKIDLTPEDFDVPNDRGRDSKTVNRVRHKKRVRHLQRIERLKRQTTITN